MVRRDRVLTFIVWGLALTPSTRDKDPALHSDIRRRLYDLIAERPGCAVSALAAVAQLPWATTQFHLLRLEREGLIETIRVGRRRLVFTREAVEGEWPEERGALQDASCLTIARAIAAEPGRDVMRLIEATGLTSRVVYLHVRRLVELGLVSMPEPGYYRGLRAAPKLYALLAEE